ncbi:CMT1A duplicated region transcript 1 protein [Lingula anatina]|uniref:CMT1A duplicated region transcript 1 protein n=1 Tax=Lingula anatina TaxID=7574 RepID=A0A1S3HFA7_LINAN|nr:CMT1A duplicated region transcript 1 protein [Lingula anatina]XP_013384757.1 CMT1A duplicated region transcript 1 protein [Lingula anatina]XP_013384758.1 CMT1A duplicated region transcript 1 protein [Lingula anatina]|eukprot:XP_013384756.1 CMT1A duplicated region transcript 1 protein [Lingula anatina]
MLADNRRIEEIPKMKHPNQNSEHFTFNLGKAHELRCIYNQKATICGKCESCQIIARTNSTKQWFLKAGDNTQKRFLLGLVRRAHSVDLLQQVVNLLHPLLNSKDFTYARNRVNPSLSTDRTTVSSDRALTLAQVEQEISSTWSWYQSAAYWTKSNFLLNLLHCCEAHLLHIVGTQAKTLLVSERSASIPADDYFEAASITSTEYTFNTEDHPEVELLSKASPGYTTPASLFRDDLTEEELVNSDRSEDEDDNSDISSIDPTCMVIPTSAKAHSGVARYKDIIRCIPVHLSKNILSMLDQTSLYNALLVSKHWRALCEEVHSEHAVNQQLHEEVMLMQGGSAQGCNPIYANDIDVAVPNLSGTDSHSTIKTGEQVIQTQFKSEVSFQTAYSGISTRNVIMEERNVYCGAYNIMILSGQNDPHRVIHTDGSRLIAIGSKDRKVRFVDNETGKEKGPVISGHAGSIRCVFLCEKEQYVLSGSYDTSIRCWSLETGACQRIFRGHQDTILCLLVVKGRLASGSKDGSCKIWMLNSGKCTRTFKHRHPVSAVAMSIEEIKEICITGCEGGKVKMWNIKTAQLLKRLDGHHGPVSTIKFDRWHIITGSKDYYALAWSAQGNHNRCLTALRHPAEVLCLEFMYLRVVTGCADGKVRIWNMVTGNCLRIMRGNSRSDPILNLIAIGNRVTLNTVNNLIVLNFENIDWDYTLENDRMPPLVTYGSYSDVPVRQQPYPYVRAKRMEKAGATNTKIVQHDKPDGKKGLSGRRAASAPQLEHSARPLSGKIMQSAMDTQSTIKPDSGYNSLWEESLYRGESRLAQRPESQKATTGMTSAKPPMSPSLHKAGPKSLMSAKSLGSRSGASSPQRSRQHISVSVMDPKVPNSDYEDSEVDAGPTDMKRRVSWAFEHALMPKTKELSLSETKALLRSQIRAKENAIPPDFIYMTINAIHQSKKSREEISRNTLMNQQDSMLGRKTRLNRPSSGPASIDPRTKIPIEEILEDWEQFQQPQHIGFHKSAESVSSAETFSTARLSKKNVPQTTSVPRPATKACAVEFVSKPVDVSPHKSMHSKKVKSTIPKAQVIRPHTAVMLRSSSTSNLPQDIGNKALRPKTAPTKLRPKTATTVHTLQSEVTASGGKVKSHGYTTSTPAATMTPMLMYPPGFREKMEQLQQVRQQKLAAQVSVIRSSSEPALGKVSQYNNPMRTHTEFRLFTHEQEEQKIANMGKITRDHNKKLEREAEKEKRELWLAKAKGQTHKDFARRPRSVAPELQEYWENSSL